jgi:hypothetical protein
VPYLYMELNFQKIVLVVAIIVFIVALVFIGIGLNKAKKEKSWPPIVSTCPDYWEDTGNGCYNKLGLGKCNLPTYDNKNLMNFNVTPYNGSEGTCAKAKWAKECEIVWDGVSSAKCP